MKPLSYKTPSRAIVWLLLPFVMLLASCQTVDRVIRPNVIVPNSLLTCEDYPAIPGEDMTDIDLALFILRTEHAWKDCSDTLSDVADLLDEQG